MKKAIIIFITIILLSTFYCSKTPAIQYPVTEKIDQVDDYHGTKVADPYRWLEDMNSEQTAKWVQAEQAVTESYLSGITFRPKLAKRLTEIFNYQHIDRPQKQGNYYIYEKNDGLQEQDILYIQDGLNGEPEILLDPNTFSKDGSVHLTSWEFSPDMKYMAYDISRGGSDWREIYVMDVKTREILKDHIEWAKFSDIAWFQDGFFYSRYEKPGEGVQYKAKTDSQKLFYHRLGTPQSEDILILENKENPELGFRGKVTDDGKYLIIDGWMGSADENYLFYKDLEKGIHAPALPLVDEKLGHCDVVTESGGKFLVKTDYQAPNNRLVQIDPQNRQPSNWQDIIPESSNKMEEANCAANCLVLTYLKDVVSVVSVFDLNGQKKYDLTLPGIGTVNRINSKKDDQEILFGFASFTTPATFYRCNVTTGESFLFKKPTVNFDPDQFETHQVFCESKDKTRVPLFITHKKGLKLDGSNPTMLYGYGGFNIARRPFFNEYIILLLENGGVYASACLRGGGEYGETWHRGGMLENKQNVFDDFIAAGEYLINSGYTSNKKLAIFGGSNGGTLIGAAINQRPELFRVAIAAVGVMDMLRYQKFTIGWAWVGEYGSSENPEQFKYLYAYSPLHNIKENIAYPAVLVTTADRDDRVFPAHSFKYISTLQEKYKGPNPVLIRIETKAGHGGASATSRRISQYADIFAFMFANMGITI